MDCRHIFSKQNKTFLKRNIGEYLHDLGLGKYLKTHKALTIKETVINYTALNLRTSVQKENTKQSTEWEKKLAIRMFDVRLEF